MKPPTTTVAPNAVGPLSIGSGEVMDQLELALGGNLRRLGEWLVTTKRDPKPRMLADRHYTRQNPGHPMWTRPGWNQILYLETRNGRGAVFCWWRPKWESGLPGTDRKDGFRAIECAIFRNETRILSSILIRKAVDKVLTWEHAQDTVWPDGLITGISSSLTMARRAPGHLPGHCFQEAGWTEFTHPGQGKRADVWLRLFPWERTLS